MSFSNTFINIINHIEDQNQSADPRGLKVKESILSNFVIDPKEPIANFEKRSFNWKYLAGELAWYLDQDRDVDFIGSFSNFWGTLTNPGTNEINSNYGSLIFNKEQFGWVIDSLVADKNSRQAIMFFNQPKFQFEGNKDFVCTMYANFFIRDNKLNMKVQMRSNDIFYGLTFDAPYFSFIHQHMRLWLLETYPELELGTYYHCADNIHFYERHFDMSSKIVSESEEQGSNYTMNIENPLFNLTKDNMILTEYGINFMRDINEAVSNESKQITYNNILREYLNIRLT